MALVSVGCKLPNGIILELGEKKVVLKGLNSSELIGGHGITEGVDKEFMDAWLLAHKHLKFVKEGFIFCHENAKNLAAEAKDRRKEKTGLEPLDQTALPKNLEKMTA